MEKFKYLFLFFLVSLASCIGTDIGDPIAETLRISGVPDQIIKGQSFEISAIYTDANGLKTIINPEWLNSNNTVLTVNNEGLVTAISEGESTLTAKANGLESSSKLKVIVSSESIKITTLPARLQVGKSFDAVINYTNSLGEIEAPSNLMWGSTNMSIATVNEAGKVTAVEVGTTKIYVSNGVVSDSVSIETTNEVVESDEKVTITTFDKELMVGDSFNYKAIFLDKESNQDDSKTITWSSSNTSVLTINSTTGVAEAVGPGDVTITASSGDAIPETIDISVSEASVLPMKTGNLSGKYGLTGKYTLFENTDGDLILKIEDYSNSAPDPFIYLGNASGNVAGALSFGLAKPGNYEFNVSDLNESANIDTYSWIIVWCEKFGQHIGSTKID